MTEPPPRDIDIERALLGACLLDPYAASTLLPSIDADDFFVDAHRLVFRAMQALHDRGAVIDLSLIVSELRRTGHLDASGGIPGLAALEQYVRDSGAAAEYAAHLRELSCLRMLARAGERIAQAAAAQEAPVPRIVAAGQRALLAAAERMSAMDSAGWDDPQADTARVTADIVSRTPEQAEREGVRSGVADLDRVCHLRSGQQMILAARPSVGKTALALQWAISAAAHGPVANICFEMPADELRQRLICWHARIPASEAMSGSLTDWQREDIQRAAEAAAALPIHFYTTRSAGRMSLELIRAEIERLIREVGPLRLVVVDYLQLIPPSAPVVKGNRNAQVEHTSRGLKAMAMDLQVPILTLSQLSREIERDQSRKSDEAPRHRLSDLRDSGAIEQDADKVAFIESPPFDHSATMRKVRIRLAKNRQGRLAVLPTDYQADMGTFVSVSPGM